MLYTRSDKVQKMVSVASPDTDGFVLLVYQFSHMGVREIFFKTGRKVPMQIYQALFLYTKLYASWMKNKQTFSWVCLLSQAVTLVVHFRI